MDIQVRSGTVDDAPALVGLLVEVNALHAALLPDIFRPVNAGDETVAFLRDWVAHAGTHLLIAQDGERPIGFALVTLHEAPPLPIVLPRRWAEVEVLVVAAADRGRGLGRILMTEAHAWAAGQGVGRVSVVVWEANAEAMRFYDRLGYTTGRRVLWRDLE